MAHRRKSHILNSERVLLERMFPPQGSWYERRKLEDLLQRIERRKKKKKKR